MRSMSGTLLALALIAALCATAAAFINPAFTPLDLMSQSDAVLLLEFKSVGEKGDAVAVVLKDRSVSVFLDKK